MLNIILLGITSLLADFSSEIILPILPFFITSLGGAGIAIGLISGVGDAMAAILKIVSGYWSDRIRRHKIFIYFGYAFSAFAKFFFPFARNWPDVFIIRTVERIGKGTRDAPRDAIVSESIERARRGWGFGIQRAMDSAGAIIGSIFVFILFWYFNLDFRTIFLIAAFIALFAIIPIIFVKEPTELEKRSPGPRPPIRFSPELKKFIVIATVFALANFSFMFFILKTQVSFSDLGERLSFGLPILLYIFFNIFDAGFSAFAGSLSDRIGRKKVISMGYALFALASLGFIFASNFLWFLILFAVYGLFKAFIDASQRAFVSDLSEPEIRATALGVFQASTGLAAIPSGVIAGIFWNFNKTTPFLYGAVLAFISVLLLLFMLKEERFKTA